MFYKEQSLFRSLGIIASSLHINSQKSNKYVVFQKHASFGCHIHHNAYIFLTLKSIFVWFVWTLLLKYKEFIQYGSKYEVTGN